MNDIMGTRAVQIVMPESARIFNNPVSPTDGLPYRERLVAFRARWMDQPLPQVQNPCRSRLGDIMKPIRVIVNLIGSNETWFLEFVSYVEAKRKLVALESLEAQVVSAIKEAIGAVRHGHLLNEDILTELNRGRHERECISPQKLGKVLAKLDFDPYNSGQKRGIMWVEELVSRLCSRYGIDYTQEGYF